MKIKVAVVVLCCLGISTLTGCDQISNLTSKFQKKETAQPAQTQAPVQTEPKTQAAVEKPLAKNMLARVGSWTLSMDEFQSRLEALKQVLPDFDPQDPASQALVLEEIIRQQLLVADARNRGLDKDKELRAAVEDFENTLLVREVANQITADISVTDEDAKQYYDDNPELFIGPLELQVSEIVVDDKEKASELLVSILGGADFAQVAKDNSKADSAKNGGDLGFISQAPFEQMQIALAGLDVDGVSSIFKGPKGFYIVKVTGKRGGEPLPYDEIKGDLVAGLTLQKQQEAVLERLNELEETINYEVNDELLGL